MKGGKRVGAGRPKTNNKTASVRLDNLSQLLMMYEKNKSKVINEAIKMWFEKNKPMIYAIFTTKKNE